MTATVKGSWRVAVGRAKTRQPAGQPLLDLRRFLIGALGFGIRSKEAMRIPRLRRRVGFWRASAFSAQAQGGVFPPQRLFTEGCPSLASLRPAKCESSSRYATVTAADLPKQSNLPTATGHIIIVLMRQFERGRRFGIRSYHEFSRGAP